MTEERCSHLAAFFSLAVQFRRHLLIYWGGGGEGVHARGAEKQQLNLLPFSAGHPFAGSPSACFIFPLYVLSSFLCQAFRPGATSVASSEERHNWPAMGGSVRSAKVLPASAGASL